MNPTIKFMFSSHVVFGLLGIAAFFASWMGLLKAKPSPKFLWRMSLMGTVFLFLSWLCGGYYYLKYYGGAAKSAIKASHYAWAHTVFTESKEHIFLFLPFLALTLSIVLFTLGDGLEENMLLKKELKLLNATIVLLGIIITLSGAVISGAVR